MFKKNKCKKCGEKLKKNYSFCPYCGNSIDSFNEADFGMLGTNDFVSLGNEVKLPFGLNKLINSLLKNLDVEMKELPLDTSSNLDNKAGISIRISNLGGNSPKIKVSNSVQQNKKSLNENLKNKLKDNFFDEEQILQFSQLKKQEPKTQIKRLSNKMMYELFLPKVSSIKDISIVKLENSIEIKALSKEIGYSKIIPINLPLLDYNFSKEKLILELGLKP